MNKLTIILILAIVAVGAWLLWTNIGPSDKTVQPEAPAAPLEPEVSPTSDIDADLQAIDIGDADVDFQEVDADLNQL